MNQVSKINSDFEQSVFFAGQVDSIVSGVVTGWCIARETGVPPQAIHVVIDGQEIQSIVCSIDRDDVRKAINTPSSTVGFSFEIPNDYFDDREHEISLRLPDRSCLPILDPENSERKVASASFQIAPVKEYMSYLDGVREGVVRGWVVCKTGKKSKPTGGHEVILYIDGRPISQHQAIRYRPDVASAINCDAACGFEISIPSTYRDPYSHKIDIKIVDLNESVSNSPITTSLVTDKMQSSLLKINKDIVELQMRLRDVYAELSAIVPKEDRTLSNYHSWAMDYFPLLRTRVHKIKSEYERTNGRMPLVSVIMPAWRPLKSDFEAAISSVIAQSYQNWELIIVDDAGNCKITNGIIDRFSKNEKRIRPIILKENVGISGATNVAIDAAQGEYIVFFDHDDLLVDVALDLMVVEAIRNKSLLVYSDEDKIDQDGYLSEPNLKPDFDYRYLLGCNYICHLSMIETKTARKIGHLRSEYDGAQDHDYMLRVTELVPREKIHHVSEILYHWRKTPNSTAVTTENKSYAVESGIKCVTDHLKRRKISSDVDSINGLTIYEVDPKIKREPTISIIIPFKDNAALTESCVYSILDNTDYSNYNIILVDNWSEYDPTKEFVQRIKKIDRVTVLRVNEPFNYSRLNNLAVKETTSDYFVFLNNDVLIEQGDWLSRLIGEFRINKSLGAVGCKLLYPNNTIQHAGLAVSPKGIASHVMAGLPANDYGYIGRAFLSHEVTAVTAAAMMVSRAAFERIKGFDEADLRVAYNDVDFCLRLRNSGYRIVFCASVVAIHHESLSRGSDDRPDRAERFFQETQTMLSRWRNNPLFERDPSYPKYFSLSGQAFYNLVEPS